MATKYIVIAGAAPALTRTSVEHLSNGSKAVTPIVPHCGTILDEGYFKEGEIGDMIRGEFIEEYRPYTLTEADITANPALANHDKLKAGDEIHAGKRGFTPSPTEAAPTEDTTSQDTTITGKKK